MANKRQRKKRTKQAQWAEASGLERRDAKGPGILTPQEIMAELDRVIIGQEKAKRAVSVALWKQQLRACGADLPNPGLLLCGPTGCGKTALAREAARVARLPFLAFDATTFSETGYKGRDVAEMVREMKERFGPRAAHGVIFFDELDKLAATAGNEYRAAYNRGTQSSLLKLIEGTEVEGMPTEGMLFLFAGAFSGLRRERAQATHTIGFGRSEEAVEADGELRPGDLIQYGMEPEMMGRIQRCVSLEALTEKDLRQILLHSGLSVFRRYQAFFQLQGKTLALGKDMEEAIIREALGRGLGACGLNALVEEWVEPKLLELAAGAR